MLYESSYWDITKFKPIENKEHLFLSSYFDRYGFRAFDLYFIERNNNNRSNQSCLFSIKPLTNLIILYSENDEIFTLEQGFNYGFINIIVFKEYYKIIN